MPLTEEQRFDLVKAEYFHLQSAVDSFDGKALTIKAWSVTFSLATIAAGFVEDAALLALLGGLSAVGFWLVEGLWKAFQDGHYARLGVLEDALQRGVLPDAPAISASWSQQYDGGRRLPRVLFYRHVLLPHLLVFAFGVIAALALGAEDMVALLGA